MIWGTTFLAMRIGVMSFPPFLFAAIRKITAGAILIFIVMIWMKEKNITPKYLMQQAVGGFLMITMGNGLVTWAEVVVPSGVAAIICSVMPAWVILINVFINRSEIPNWIIVIGVFIGMSGIIMVFSEYLIEFMDPRYAWGIVLIFVATISWSIGSINTKQKHKTHSPFLNAGMQMFFGGLLCLPFSWAFDDWSNIVFNQDVIWSLVYLILFGSLMAYAMYFYVLTHLPVTIASLYAYINPLVAMVLGWLVLSEKLNAMIVVAFLVTILGIYLVNRGYQIKLKKSRAPFLTK